MDANFKKIKIIKAFSSLQWTERYYGAGSFELHCGARFLDAIFNGAYVRRKDKLYAGVIEERSAEGNSGEIVAKGRFLESVLHTRVIETTAVFAGNAETVCRNIVAQYCMTGERAIPRLALGVNNYIGSDVAAQRTGKTAFDAISEILTEQEASFRTRYDPASDSIIFEVFKGADRTKSQNQNSWCVFSTSFYNILSETYKEFSDARNFAYVAGAGEGADRIVEIVDETGGSARKELYVDARDAQPTDGQSDADYRLLLRNRGLAKLAEWNAPPSAEFEIDMNNAPFFGLGDKCVYTRPDIGIVAEGRVTEIYETIEDDGLTVGAVLGGEKLNIIQKIKRSAV